MMASNPNPMNPNMILSPHEKSYDHEKEIAHCPTNAVYRDTRIISTRTATRNAFLGITSPSVRSGQSSQHVKLKRTSSSSPATQPMQEDPRLSKWIFSSSLPPSRNNISFKHFFALKYVKVGIFIRRIGITW